MKHVFTFPNTKHQEMATFAKSPLQFESKVSTISLLCRQNEMTLSEKTHYGDGYKN